MSFSTLKHEKQYLGKAFDVSKVHIRLPDGRKRVYDLVDHGDSVTILPVDENGNIYFVNQHRIGSDGELLELPAGVLDDGESPLETAKREVREEIGMAAKEIASLGEFFLAPGYSDEKNFVFLATELFNSPLDGDDDEFLDVVALSIEEVYQNAFAGEFQDAKTLAALLLAMPILIKEQNFADYCLD